VVVPVLPGEWSLSRRLAELSAQSIAADLEILVVTGRGCERDLEPLATTGEGFAALTVLALDEPLGRFRAWNRGLRRASAELVSVLGFAVSLRCDAFEKLARALDERREAAVAYADGYRTWDTPPRFERHLRRGCDVRPDFHPAITRGGDAVGDFAVWRRELHQQIGYFDERFEYAADYAFWCRVGGVAPLAHVPDFLSVSSTRANVAGGRALGCERAMEESLRALERERSQIRRSLSLRTERLRVGRARSAPQYADGPSNGYANICMVTFDRLDFTRRALEAVLRFTEHPHVITVVDNDSQDGTREYLEQQLRRGVLTNLMLLDENVGVARASNLAWAAEPDAAYYVKLDNDIVIEKPGWLSAMVRTIEAAPSLGVIGYNFEDASYAVSPVDGVSVRTKSGNIGGACILIPKRTEETLGYWCEEYGLYGEEDADYGLRVHLAGLHNAYMQDEHIGVHLPGGRAAAIDPESAVAADVDEQRTHARYRLWKDQRRRENLQVGSAYVRNQEAYKAGEKPLFVARSREVPYFTSTA